MSEQVYKAFFVMFLLMCAVLIFTGIISADMNVNNAQNYNTQIIRKLEESNKVQKVVEECISNTNQIPGYDLEVENILNADNEISALKVVLNYSYKIPILGVSQKHKIISYVR